MERERRRRADGIIFYNEFSHRASALNGAHGNAHPLGGSCGNYSERAGMVNIGLDGIMAIGAWWAFWWDMKQEVPGREF